MVNNTLPQKDVLLYCIVQARLQFRFSKYIQFPVGNNLSAVADPEGGTRGVPQLIARISLVQSLVQSMSHIKYSSECTIKYCIMTKYTPSPEAIQAFCVWGETSKLCVDVKGVLSKYTY